MKSSNYVHLDVDEILSETDNAFLVLLNEEEIWIPKSVISDSKDYDKGDVECSISVQRWFTEKNELGEN